MSGSVSDGIVVDPVTGAIISSPLTNADGPGLGATLGAAASDVRGLFPPTGAAAAPVLPPEQTPGLLNGQPQAAPQAAPVLPPSQTPGLVDQGTWDAPPSSQPAPSGVPSPSGAQARLAQAQSLAPNAAPPGAPQAPPPAAPSGAPAAGAQPPTDASNIPSIPNQFQGVMTDAANKYGVPPAVLQWTIGHESSFNPSAVNHISGASGIAQFMPDTAKQYGVDVSDPVSSINGAARYLSDLYKKTGSWDGAVAAYGTFSPTVGSQDAGLHAGFNTAMKNAGVNLGAPGQQAQQTQGAPGDGTSQGQDTGVQSLDDYMNSPGMQRIASMMRPSQSQSLMALASGLLSGPTFGAGLGKGLANLNQLSTQGRQEYMQLANIGLQNMRMDQTLRLGQGRLNISQQNADTGKQRADQTGQHYQWQQDPDAQAAVAGAKKSAQAQASDANSDIDQMQENGQNAAVKQQQIQSMQQLLQGGQVNSGPGIQALKRNIVSYFGLPESDANQTGAAIASQIRGSGIMGKNMRTQKEFNTVMEGLPNIETMNPQVLQGVVNGLSNMNGLQQNLYKNWNSLPRAQQTQMRSDPDAYNQWWSQQAGAWQDQMGKQGGLYATPGGSQAPNASAPSGKATSGTTNGISWSFTPNQ